MSATRRVNFSSLTQKEKEKIISLHITHGISPKLLADRFSTSSDSVVKFLRANNAYRNRLFE